MTEVRSFKHTIPSKVAAMIGTARIAIRLRKVEIDAYTNDINNELVENGYEPLNINHASDGMLTNSETYSHQDRINAFNEIKPLLKRVEDAEKWIQFPHKERFMIRASDNSVIHYLLASIAELLEIGIMAPARYGDLGYVFVADNGSENGQTAFLSKAVMQNMVDVNDISWYDKEVMSNMLHQYAIPVMNPEMLEV